MTVLLAERVAVMTLTLHQQGTEGLVAVCIAEG